jgi:ribosomal protein S18 acetylase RimI-like enzyme
MEKIILGGKEIVIRKLMASDLKNARKFANYINSLIEEDVYLTVNKKYSLKDETVFLKGQIEKMKKKNNVFLIAEAEKKIVGVSNIERMNGKQGHVGLFFLYPVSLLRGTKRMRSPEETSSGCGGVNTPTQEPDLFGISIAREWRGIGLGTILLDEIFKMAKKDFKPSIKMITLDVIADNKPAFSLYRRMGFKKVAVLPRYFQHRGGLLDIIVMNLYL